ncbi:peptidylprolyl isomerase [Cohnella sp.]|uniref:peptidylprolyl isomerase n=1 Tax=Cohnella sp. TaxID=1883426 RepID=UPI00356A6291
MDDGGQGAGKKERSAAYVLALMLAALLLAAGSLAAGYGWADSGSASEQRELSVNGEPVTAEELALYVSRNRALVADYFRQAYGAEYSEDFWSASFSGEAPLLKLNEAVKEQLVRTKVELQLAKRAGVEENIGYEHFLERLKIENARRAAAVERNEAVYGPTRLDARSYYFHELTLIRQAAIEAMLASGALSVTETELKEQYEAYRTLAAEAAGTTIAQWASLAYGDAAGAPTRERAYERMRELQSALSAGEALEETAALLSIPFASATLNETTRRSYALDHPLAILAIDGMEAGEASDVLEENGAFHLIRVEKRTPAEAREYEEIRGSMAERLAERKYERLVEAEAGAADVQWDDGSAAARIGRVLGIE